MSKLSRIVLPSSYAGKLLMREALFQPRTPLPAQMSELERLGEITHTGLVRKLLSEHFSFSEAFVAMCYALRVSNQYLEDAYFSALDDFGNPGNLLAGREMLSGFAIKEARAHLTPEEVAGMVAATMLDILRYPSYGPVIFENCGMGGDRGIRINGESSNRKTINGSTLSTLVVAALGHKTAKHGSYSNTSAVGSTDAIEKLGVIVDTPTVSAQESLANTNFHFTCAHAWKTVHDLSHAPPKRETVNHVIGPMTPPVNPVTTRLDKVVGVSDKLHPVIVVRAYEILREKGLVNLRHAAAVCGLDKLLEPGELGMHTRVREATVLDEFSPYASVVSILRNGEYAGMHQLTPRMFGVTFRDPRSVFVCNDEASIMEANRRALRGEDIGDQLPEYLAMNAAFSLYMIRSLSDDPVSKNRPPDSDALRDSFRECHEAIRDGRVASFLDEYIQFSHSLVS